ncbi:ThiF family adenylyltransferase [Flammeovirga sp. OC4]|uniref:HesA/MoeB/ThiF family protein n=1 Tax=Flammeovirga sp. OC4 TaxID=1382345 RepID=UPI0009E584C5|nr:ThiF family adenylyltransferase [Flammeovirga sp. OC4]
MMFERNIGLITEVQQAKLSEGSVLIAGVGGMGGVAAEVLVRMGVGNITICDFDIFETSNCNRQLYSNSITIGQHKAEVLKEKFLEINKELNIRAVIEPVQLANVEELLENIDVIINGMDDMFSSIVLERTARKKNITIVDAWLTPYASVFVMKPDSPHWEDYLELPTAGVPIDAITEEMCVEAVRKEVEYTFSHFSPFSIIDKDCVGDVLHGKRPRPSLAPVVWLSGTLMANEAFKVLTDQKHTDHKGIFLDQYDYAIKKG